MSESALHLFTLVFSVLKAAFVLAIPFAILSFICGLVSGVVQTGTSVHDQSISTVPKLICTGLLLLVLGGWLVNSMTMLTANLFSDFSVFTGG